MKNKNHSIFSEYEEPIKEAINDLKTKGKRHRQIPNILTLTRLTAPLFIIPAAATANITLVIGLVAFFSLTDFVDGFIARNWNLTSKLGEALDATTDKVFASTLLLAASFTNPILLCNLGLEAVISGINVNKKLNNQIVKSSLIGKIKTWFLFTLTGLGIISSYFDIAPVLNTLMLTTTIMQVATIGSYLFVPSQNKKLSKKVESEIITLDVNNNINSQELTNEKIIKKINSEIENNSVKQLNEIKEFLISEQDFLQEENHQIDIKVKSKK